MAHFSAEDIENANGEFRRNLINSATGFKSVTLVGTANNQGQTNLAIFSQVMHIGANPPLIGILFRPHTVVRNTLENIIETKSFTINHFDTTHYREAHHTSARWEASEYESCGFEPIYVKGIEAPFVKDAPVQIGLKYEEKHDLTINGTHLIIGSIQYLRVADEAISEDGFIDLESLGVVTCSGLDSYHSTQRLSRLSYAKPSRQPKDVS
ncbi:MAG: flavin reductase [Cyclobacteriaceae bacterium]